MAFKILGSYQIEELSQLFCKSAINKNDPFKAVHCLVQSVGMERWLKLECAQNNGVSTNLSFDYPSSFIRKIARRSMGITKSRKYLDMVWLIYSRLPSLEEEFTILKDYMEAGSDLYFRRYQFACQLSKVYERYMSYRLDWLISWENNIYDLTGSEHEIWQAKLWKMIKDEIEGVVSVNLLSQLQDKSQIIESLSKIKSSLPDKLLIFGIPSLPPIYIDFFEALSELIDIEFYYLAPCEDYWGDVNRFDVNQNILLGRWGGLGKDFYNDLLQKDILSFEDIKNSSSSDKKDHNDSLLRAVQQSIILNLPNLGESLKIGDDSLKIVSHYSRQREVEGLYNWLLKIMKDDVTLQPREIIVMMPNVKDYASAIEAVFGNPERGELALAYSIADRTQGEKSKVVKVITQLLSLAQGRLTAEEIFEFIELPLVSKKYEFSTEDLAKIANWLKKSAIAWGVDENFRSKALGFEYDVLQNTWKFGFDRLMAGYIYATDEVISDYNGVKLGVFMTQNDGVLFGKFRSLCDNIFRLIGCLLEAKSGETWHDLLVEILESFIVVDRETEREFYELTNFFAKLKEDWQLVGISEELSFTVICSCLNEKFENETINQGFLNGKITFCRMLPMRSIPMKVICILGMNDREFPHQEVTLGFDLMNVHGRASDRSLRREEKYLFLETLLSARENFYLSYIGQNNMDNSEIPPSIIVSELLDYLGDEKIVEKHPLQPFSEVYFLENSKLLNYSIINYEVAKTLQEKRISKLLNDELNELPYDEIVLSFEEFVSFFISPSKGLLRHTLNMRVGSNFTEEFSENEPFLLEKLENFLIKKEMLDDIMHNQFCLQNDESKKWVNSKYLLSGRLPVINAENILDNIHEDLQELTADVANYGNKENFDDVFTHEVVLDKLKIIISGKFSQIFNKNGVLTQVFYRPSAIKNKDKLAGFIWHVLVNNLSPHKGVRTIVIGEKSRYEFNDFSYMDIKFNNLLQVLKAGLSSPIAFFLNSSFSYIAALQKNGQELCDDNFYSNIKGKLKENWITYNGLDCDGVLDEIKMIYGNQYPLDNEELFNDFKKYSELIIDFQLKSESSNKRSKK